MPLLYRVVSTASRQTPRLVMEPLSPDPSTRTEIHTFANRTYHHYVSTRELAEALRAALTTSQPESRHSIEIHFDALGDTDTYDTEVRSMIAGLKKSSA